MYVGKSVWKFSIILFTFSDIQLKIIYYFRKAFQLYKYLLLTLNSIKKKFELEILIRYGWNPRRIK